MWNLVRPTRAAACAVLFAMCVAGAVQAQPADLSSIVRPGAAFEKIAFGFRYTEGPVWDQHGWLLFSDIPANTIYQWLPGPPARHDQIALPAPLIGSLRVFQRPSASSNGLAEDGQGRLVAAQHDRRVTRFNADGSGETLVATFEGKRLNSPNDLVVKSDGSVYFTDPPYGLPDPKSRELAFSGIYRVAVDGKVSLVEKSMAFPNGLAFSPDESRLYVVESEADEIRVFDVAPDGTLSKPRLFAEVKLVGSHEGPDGLKVDDRGNVFCAGPDGIWIFEPSGKLLGKLPLPEVPANLAFGGDDRATLYVTARTGVYRIELKTSGHASRR